MKYYRLYNFISPVTGKLPINRGYILLGDKDGRSFSSPVLIDVRQDIIDLRKAVDFFDNFKNITPNHIWIGDKFKRPVEQLRIGVINLPELKEAIFPNPISDLSGDFRIPNPTFNYTSAFDWVMSGPFLPQIYATSYDIQGNPTGTDISSSLAMSQVRIAQIMKRFDNADFIVGSSNINFTWENPKMQFIPKQLSDLYGLGETYTFTKAQSLGSLETGILKNTVQDAKGKLSKAISGVDLVDFTENPIGEFVVRPDPLSKHIATIPIRVEDVETTIAGLGALKIAYDIFAAETVAKDAAQDVQITAINSKDISQDGAISAVESIATSAKETAIVAQETAVSAEETAVVAEETAIAAEASVAALQVEFETQIAVLAGVETLTALATILGWIGLAANTKNYSEYVRGQTLNIKNTWKSSDKNDEGHNAVGDFEFRYPSGYSSDDRGHGTLWFDSNGRTDTHKAEGGLRLFSWDSGGDHLGYDDPIAPIHIGLFGYQNKYNVWPLPNPTPMYKGFIFRSTFHNEDSDSDNYRFPKNFGLYDVKKTISTLNNQIWGWDYLHPIFEYDYDNFTFYKKLKIKEHCEFEKNIRFSTKDYIIMPVGETSNRPSEQEIGMFRYNNDINGFEYSDGVNWLNFNNSTKSINLSGAVIGSGENDINTVLNSNQTLINNRLSFFYTYDGFTSNYTYSHILPESNSPSQFKQIIGSSDNIVPRNWSLNYNLGTSSNPNSSFSISFYHYLTGQFEPFKLQYDGAKFNLIFNGIINFSNNKLSGVADPVDDQDAVTKKFAKSLVENIPASSIKDYPSNSSKFLRGDGKWEVPQTSGNVSGSIVGDIKQSIKTQDHNGWLKWRQGRVLSRTTYAELWAEVVASGLIDTGMFGNGDGTTTFTMLYGGSRLLGVASQDSPYSGLRSAYINPRHHGEIGGVEYVNKVYNHTHTMNHTHSATISSNTHSHSMQNHTHSIGHTHSSFNTASDTHQHNLVTFNTNNTNSNLDTVVYQYTTQTSGNGGFSDYDATGGASPFRVLYTVGLRNTTSSNSHLHTISIPAFNGTSGPSNFGNTTVDTHNHTISIDSNTSSTGATGDYIIDNMNPYLFLNLFIYSGVV